MKKKGSRIADEIIEEWNRAEHFKKLAQDIKKLNNKNKGEQNEVYNKQ